MAPDPQHLRGVVDMGSNGIRFSISDLSPPHTRIIPTLYQDRAGISLYDAQFRPGNQERQAVGKDTIDAVLTHLRRFKSVCEDFGVPNSNITVLATEATRTAPNSSEYLKCIKDGVGWDVTLLAKEDEGRIGAMGVCSSLGEVKGLMMDLGGGSTQLTWLYTDRHGNIQMPEHGSLSMPYGAAAMSRLLDEARSAGGNAMSDLATEIKTRVKEAYDTLHVPKDIRNADGTTTLYLSGGGFRGWGYILMDSHAIQPYPITIINGFSAPRSTFLDTASVEAAITSTTDDIFRISARRASQVPAVAFLIRALSSALPNITQVQFCQGGVREGYLFSSLPREIQTQHPLEVASRQFSPLHASRSITSLLGSSLPQQIFPTYILASLGHMLHLQSAAPKDARQVAALRCTTTGPLTAAHGLSHVDRALLALLLCERHGRRDDLPRAERDFYSTLEGLVPVEQRWWTRYLGRVAALVGAVYPAGIAGGSSARLSFKAKIGTGKKGAERVELHVKFADRKGWGGEGGILEAFAAELAELEWVGKKKNRDEGEGFKVEVEAEVKHGFFGMGGI